MATQRVEGGGGSMIQCKNCGNYYDSSSHFICPYCSAESPNLTEVLFKGSHSDAENNHPVTEAVDMPAYSGRHRNQDMSGRTQIADNIESRSAGHTQIADNIETRPVGHTQIAGHPGGHAGGGFAPVVGWLVAMNGPCAGTDYRLHAGYNFIGRDRGDICIHGDPAISKEKDSCINYDQRGRAFYLTHENGINQTLLNNRSVMREAAELYQYDIVTIGQTNFLFMPLCGRNFNWNW